MEVNDIDLNKVVESCGKDIVILDANYYNAIVKASCLYSNDFNYILRKMNDLVLKSDRKLKRDVVKELKDIIIEIEKRRCNYEREK